MAMIGPFITFYNGIKFPQFGLGTWQSTKEECKTAVRAALDAGYRHFDSAFAYGNEADIGEVINEYIKAGKIKREDVFITSKLWSTFMEPSKVAEGCDISLKALGLDYIDLYLAHNSMAFKNTSSGGAFPTNPDGTPAVLDVKVQDTWAAMEKLVKNGKVKSIGVSNYSAEQVDRIVKHGTIKPVTNQVECHAYMRQEELFNACKKHNVYLTSYGSLGSPGRPESFRDNSHPVLMEEPFIKQLATKHKKSPGQILLRELIQRGIIIIPKSSNPKRIKENSEIFDFQLSPAEMKQIADLDKKLRLFGSFDILKCHPEYPFHA
ncbi:hypothetical protein LOTGIDRAFT_158920 [Lottia gigantea]|uniref:NADP-dependent oxidoreductase domain-containing protein n=1 Tax=Lottia gigantea TaxID=225164 RepID=V4AP45_LOTGI|nr:hypothetical protein LOTGIDRAFT_158920 [Lottia gigantea]ESO98957.1 hypothetical protein LOTGIDRAFT_158920 [Lottia gigantea]